MSVPTLLAATARAESPSAHDPRFDVIEQLLESADFEGAEAASIRLLASGALSRSEVARAHLELGIVDGARGRMKEAELEFLRAIALDATAALPATVG
ncbi:MAG TPA: hypothetical protein VFQ35_03020, partial [Polyangiaceae bacterium]|nr:hypothetical protein [Polyangiaceae bacterium]